MTRCILWGVLASALTFMLSTQAYAEVRRDSGSAQASKKAQYMIRQLHNEKQELQTKLVELQGKFDQLSKQHKKTIVRLDKSSENNEKLVSRVKGTADKFNELAGKYREAITILRKANMDNQYMVRAVQEREHWMSSCTDRNNDLFQSNNDLLAKYGEAAGSNAEPFIGITMVEIENEVQDYRFKLEDLQVTKFKPIVDVAAHAGKVKQPLNKSDSDAPIN